MVVSRASLAGDTTVHLPCSDQAPDQIDRNNRIPIDSRLKPKIMEFPTTILLLILANRSSSVSPSFSGCHRMCSLVSRFDSRSRFKRDQAEKQTAIDPYVSPRSSSRSISRAHSCGRRESGLLARLRIAALSRLLRIRERAFPLLEVLPIRLQQCARVRTEQREENRHSQLRPDRRLPEPVCPHKGGAPGNAVDAEAQPGGDVRPVAERLPSPRTTYDEHRLLLKAKPRPATAGTISAGYNPRCLPCGANGAAEPKRCWTRCFP